jgi:ABC-type lipopolysaccharide export system ATPase subunit
VLTVSQLSKSFAGRALFDDVSLQVNRGDLIVEIEADGGAGDLQEDVGLAAASKLQSDRSSKIALT